MCLFLCSASKEFCVSCLARLLGWLAPIFSFLVTYYSGVASSLPQPWSRPHPPAQPQSHTSWSHLSPAYLQPLKSSPDSIRDLAGPWGRTTSQSCLCLPVSGWTRVIPSILSCDSPLRVLGRHKANPQELSSTGHHLSYLSNGNKALFDIQETREDPVTLMSVLDREQKFWKEFSFSF